MITNNLSTLDIHQLSEQQFQRIVENNEYDENALYLTPDKGVLIVTIDEENQRASHTPKQIYDHIQTGGTATLKMTDYVIGVPLLEVSEYGAKFGYFNAEENVLESLHILDNGSFERFQSFIATTNMVIPPPDLAHVGQTIKVTAVDSNGIPIAWEAADLPKQTMMFKVSTYYCLAEVGMTWSQWVRSRYNFEGFDDDGQNPVDMNGDVISEDGIHAVDSREQIRNIKYTTL